MAELPVTYLLTFSESEAPNEIDSEWHELIRCKDCTKWDRHDGTFKDFDGKEWHNCKTLCFRTMAYFYCADAEREAE